MASASSLPLLRRSVVCLRGRCGGIATSSSSASGTARWRPAAATTAACPPALMQRQLLHLSMGARGVAWATQRSRGPCAAQRSFGSAVKKGTAFGQRVAQLSETIEKSDRKWIVYVVAIIVGALPAYFVYDNWLVGQKVKEYRGAIGDKVYMDIAIGDKYAGRLLIGLYSRMVPLTCENFLQFCKGYRVRDKVLGYQNTFFHTIRPGACVVGGDVLTGTGKTHGISIYGEAFPDENFDMEFLRDGDLAMINWGKNTNSSIFMITLSRQQHMYGHHVVFGTVIKGMRVLREMGEMGTRMGRPALPIKILQCGVVEEGEELPAPPMNFMPKVGPMLTEDEFRSKQVDKPGTAQPS
eukprot:TRINITY_DN73768_c0_g1_i1.p1 TRINITY_DN73768_c0_g1~~TRINITY_DN73768_c0_g1_i1.p1  ORF type:complete len:353 (-),score=71.65 TRINITY_DN73768_c0_g1_i1:88-1146(-)